MVGIAPARDTGPPQTDADGPNRLASKVFVWGIWVALLVAHLGFVWVYGLTIPYLDDWYHLVPALTGEQPITLFWLWEQYSEMRIPLLKLVNVVTFKTVGPFAALVLNVFVQAALALLLIRLAERLRGWTHYADAFFPLSVLHWGQYEATTWTTGCYWITWPAVLLAAVLFAVADLRSPVLTVRRAGYVVLLVLAATLVSGPEGLAYIPALGLWLLYAGFLSLRAPAPQERRNGGLIITLAVALILFVPLYYVGYEAPGVVETTSDPLRIMKGAVTFLTMSISRMAANPGIVSYTIPAILLLAMLTSALLASAWFRLPQDRCRAAGLLLFLGGVASLALGVGYGRSYIYEIHNQARYVLFALPFLWCVYYVWELYGPPAGRRLVQMGLFTALCVLFIPNTQDGLDKNYRGYEDNFRQSVDAGWPLTLLAERHGHFLTAGGRVEEIPGDLRGLKAAGLAPFNAIRLDPKYKEVPLPLETADRENLTLENGVATGSDAECSLNFALLRFRFVYGIRIEYLREESSGAVFTQVFWRRKGEVNLGAESQSDSTWILATGAEKIATFWVEDWIDAFRIQAHLGSTPIRILSVRLLVPTADK